ncbi:MAG: peptidylprolyl isomerase [Candidatus Omnitrophica bacterium]|nr:peptidylprolyl isomerase [Candidatus Omnitrophota bacterium]
MRSVVVALAMVAGLMMSGSLVRAEDMVITKGKLVKFDYTLTVDNKEVESTKGKQPLEYTQGQNMLIPGLEKALEGAKAGDTKKVVVKPEEGYGKVNPTLVREFDKTKLPKGMEPKVGMILEVQDPQGNAFPCTVTEVKDKVIMLDFNHPLAGKELTFDVKVVSVENAPVAPAAVAAPAAAPAPAATAPAAKAPEAKK